MNQIKMGIVIYDLFLNIVTFIIAFRYHLWSQPFPIPMLALFFWGDIKFIYNRIKGKNNDVMDDLICVSAVLKSVIIFIVVFIAIVIGISEISKNLSRV